MEEQLAELAAKVAELEAKANVTNTMFAETYYYLTIPLMVIIHAGFLAYEMGASRLKNVLASGIKNILAFAFMVPTFYYFGWFFYWYLQPGPFEFSWQTGIDFANPIGEVMGPNLADNATGVFWGAFTLFAATTASIFSGAVIERNLDVAVARQTVLLNGFSFATQNEDGTPVTRVIAAPVGSGFSVSDKVVAFMATGEALDGSLSMKELIERELAAGRTNFSFAVERQGEIWVKDFQLAALAN